MICRDIPIQPTRRPPLRLVKQASAYGLFDRVIVDYYDLDSASLTHVRASLASARRSVRQAALSPSPMSTIIVSPREKTPN